MSVKIWEAYKLKPSVDLWKFLADVRVKAEKAAREKIKSDIKTLCVTYNDGKADLKKDILNLYRAHPDTVEMYKGFITTVQASDLIRRAYVDADLKHQRIFNYDCQLAVRQNRGRYYFIPYDGIGALAFLKRDRRVTDYHYQNQSDQPSNISNRAWNERRKTWEEMSGPDDEHWWDFLTLEVLSPGLWWRLTPWHDKELSDWWKERWGKNA